MPFLTKAPQLPYEVNRPAGSAYSPCIVGTGLAPVLVPLRSPWGGEMGLLSRYFLGRQVQKRKT